MRQAVTVMLGLGLGASGCVDDTGPEPGAAIVSQASCGETLQGRHMLGAAPDSLTNNVPGQRFASVRTLSSNRAGVSVSVVGGGLVARDSAGATLYAGASSMFVGMRLRTQIGAELEIVGVAAETWGASYALAFYPSKVNYCGGPGGSAVAMQGAIEADRFHVWTSDVTFGCRDGVLRKCYDWDYVPGNDPNSSEWKHHQACMRMANADIYGDGEVHTRELTPIVIRDMISGANPAPSDAPALGFPLMTPAPPGISFFEAAWSSARGEGAVCLAHDRWLSEPIDGPQHDALPDPRRVDNIDRCDDLTFKQMSDRGALVFNASRRMDMYLNRWRKPSGDVLTTVRGLYNHDSLRHAPPLPGFNEFLGNDGVMLRNLTGLLTAADVTEMYMQHNPDTDDYVVATKVPVAPGYVIGDFEGYTLNFDGPDLIPFGLFKKGNDYVSAAPGWAPQAGYTFVAPLHNVMRTQTADTGPPAPPPTFAARACSEQ